MVGLRNYLRIFHVNATVLNELIQCRDGVLCLSDDSFSKDDIAQVIASLCTNRFCLFALICVFVSYYVYSIVY